jgi:hypothetical protein
MLGGRPTPTTPFEVVSADYLKLPKTKAGNLYLIVHTRIGPNIRRGFFFFQNRELQSGG